MQNTIINLLKNQDYSALKNMFEDINVADIASIFEEMFGEMIEERELIILFRLLPKDIAADCFSFLDSDMQRILISAFSDRELQEVLEQTFVDDAVDMIEEMPANVVSRILRNADAETRAAINEILKYPKDSAGSIMTIEYEGSICSCLVLLKFGIITI